MTTPTADLFEVLEVAQDHGSVDRAITRAGKTAMREAEKQQLILVVHTTLGVVGAHYACIQAGYVEQRDLLHLELTAAGRDYLAGA